MVGEATLREGAVSRDTAKPRREGLVETFRFGKGRVVTLAYAQSGRGLFPRQPFDREWLARTECDSVLLSPCVSDPNGDALTYEWSVTGGFLADLYAAATLYTAPATENCDGIDVTITLTVTDPCGLSATDSILVRVENINQPPIVKADP